MNDAWEGWQDFPYAVPTLDPKTGLYRHSAACDPDEDACVCGMDSALIDAERLSMEWEQGA